jgi:3-deoxy-7-phosphoheptulonate synthase / chorismate mutase
MTADSRISELREQVDEINMQLLELLNKRARVVSEIGKEHARMGSRFYDPAREAQMLQVLEQANTGPFSHETIKALFREIFRASLAL